MLHIKKNLLIAALMTIVTTIVLGLVYPLVVTGLAQVLFPDQANGQLRSRNGQTIGSEILAQGFASPRYFHSRASAAGQGYDAASSGGTNLGPTNRTLVDAVRAAADAAKKERAGAAVPIDMITTSASGLDPHITPENAMFQSRRVARARGISEEDLRRLVEARVEGRQFGWLGEPRVNVLMLNLALDERWPLTREAEQDGRDGGRR